MKIKFRISYWVRYVYIAVITLAIIAIGSSGFFLYDHFYRTMIQAQVVLLLKSEVVFDSIDIHVWNKIIKNFENKKISILKNREIIDPFISLVEEPKK